VCLSRKDRNYASLFRFLPLPPSGSITVPYLYGQYSEFKHTFKLFCDDQHVQLGTIFLVAVGDLELLILLVLHRLLGNASDLKLNCKVIKMLF